MFRGMNIHKSQLFWCELQGYKVLTHCHLFMMLLYLFSFLVEFVACLLRYRLMISPSLSASLIILWTISKILHLNWTLQGHRLQGAHELQTSTRRPAWVGFGEGLALSGSCPADSGKLIGCQGALPVIYYNGIYYVMNYCIMGFIFWLFKIVNGKWPIEIDD